MGLGERAGRLKAVSVFATDGAVWTVVLDDTSQPSGGHLARISATDGYQLVATDPVACGGSAGPDGSVWVIQNGEVVRYLPDGTRASAGLPERLDPVSDEYIPEVANGVCLHGVDPTGVVWVSEFVDVEGEECTAGTWHRWDGQRWTTAEAPDPFASALQRVVASDEVGRVLRFVEDSDAKSGTELARYSDGKLVPVATAPRMDSLTAVRGQQACVLEYADLYGNDPAIVCYDADGEVARIDVTGRGVGHFSIAPDGSIWLLGPQAARLPQKLADP